jgi:hypothetical protein
MFCAGCGTNLKTTDQYCFQCGRETGPAGKATRVEAFATGPLPVPPPSAADPAPGPVRRAVSMARQIPSYLPQAIVVTLFCCMPLGLVSVVYASQVSGKLQAGDERGAMRSSDHAKNWAWASLIVGLVAYFIGFLAGLLGD